MNLRRTVNLEDEALSSTVAVSTPKRTVVSVCIDSELVVISVIFRPRSRFCPESSSRYGDRE